MSKDALINYPGLPCPIEIIALLSTKERISLRASSCDSTSSQQSQHINAILEGSNMLQHFPAPTKIFTWVKAPGSKLAEYAETKSADTATFRGM